MAARSRIAEILLKTKVIDELQLRSALARQDQWGERLTMIVRDMGLADEEHLTETLARSLGVPRAQLGHIPRDPTALGKLDVGYASEKGIFPAAMKDGGKTLLLAMADPTDLATLDEVTRRARCRVVVAMASETEITHAISRHYKGIEPQQRTQSAARTAVKAASQESGDDEEFKIVDMSGNTVMKRIADIDPSLAGEKPGSVTSPPTGGGGGAGDLLDDLMGAGEPQAPVFTPEELQRVSSVHANQSKSGMIVKAVIALLVEKGYLTPQEAAARFKL